MQTHEIRKRFLDHFVKAGHTEVPSASVILDDPNLLFVNAGMVQFVPFFLGQRTPPYDKATSVQKCIRTPDIDEVGITTRHNTFFQMAGNFSFGDYFKRGAIELAWALLTNPVARTAATGSIPRSCGPLSTTTMTRPRSCGGRSPVCPPSASSAAAWPTTTGRWASPGRAGRRRRSTTTADRNTASTVARLPTRTATSRSGTSCSCRTSAATAPPRTTSRSSGRCRARTSTPAWASSGWPACCRAWTTSTKPTCCAPSSMSVATVSPRGYGAGNHEDDVRYRIIADHSRTAAIIIGDGVTPGNEGRGYVLRRLLRRIIRAAKLLGVEQPVMADLMVTVRDAMGPSYPELVTDFDRINRIAVAEETAFNRTLAAGSRLFEEAAQTTQLGRQDDAERDRRLHPARHLRLPDRPDAGNGFRGRTFRRRARLPRADGRAASPGQGRRRGAQARACRPDRLPRTRRRRPHRVHRIRRIELRGKDSRDIRGRQAGAGGGARCSVRFGGAGRRARRDRAGPHAAVRGVRRSDRRRGVHRRGPAWRGASAQSPTSRRSPRRCSCTASTSNPASSSRATPSPRPSIRSGATVPPRVTRAPTWCTPRYDRSWAPTPFRPAR